MPHPCRTRPIKKTINTGSTTQIQIGTKMLPKSIIVLLFNRSTFFFPFPGRFHSYNAECTRKVGKK